MFENALHFIVFVGVIVMMIIGLFSGDTDSAPSDAGTTRHLTPRLGNVIQRGPGSFTLYDQKGGQICNVSTGPGWRLHLITPDKFILTDGSRYREYSSAGKPGRNY
jgi:hypothetical protein